jgi:hypothetical protein
MSTKQFTLAVVVLALLACQLQAGIVNSKWVGGSSGQWETASNWNPAIVPDNSATRTFAVTIDGGTGGVKVILAYGHGIDSMWCYGDVTFQPSMQYAPVKLSMANPSGLTNYQEFHTTAWAVRLIEIGGNVNNTSGATIDFWGVKVWGDLINPAGGSVQINGSASTGNTTNDGNLLIADKFTVHGKLANSGQIDIYNCGYDCDAFENTVAGKVTGFGTGFCASSWTNEGKILATGGSLCLLTISGSVANLGTLANDPLAAMNIKHMGQGLPPAANNSGTIEVNAGGGIAFDCDLVNEANAVIKLLGGTLAAKTVTQKVGAILQGFGWITGNVVIESNAVIRLTGPTNIVGNLTIAEGATLDISDGTVLVTGLTTCNGGTIQTRNATIITQGGTSGGICKRVVN